MSRLFIFLLGMQDGTIIRMRAFLVSEEWRKECPNYRPNSCHIQSRRLTYSVFGETLSGEQVMRTASKVSSAGVDIIHKINAVFINSPASGGCLHRHRAVQMIT